jgi:branched-subunit amino acid aminotransferase/4-amino-4-deoxychorismate lyase
VTTKVFIATGDAPGRIEDPERATISVFDRGFLYGDSVYETMRTAGGLPLELEGHLERLHRSAAGIGLDVPGTDPELAASIAATHAASGNDESYVRVIVTRGSGPLMLDPRASISPTIVIVVQPLSLPTAEAYERGIAAVVVDRTKGESGLDPSIKSGNYLANVLALREAIAAGGDDAIMKSATGDIAEGATSNLFLVTGGGTHLVTPSIETGLLEGITRRVVFRLARGLGFPPHEGRVTHDDLLAASEVFLTSSVRGIMPVTKIDGRPVGEGTAGPVWRRLHGAYTAYVAEATARARASAGPLRGPAGRG